MLEHTVSDVFREGGDGPDGIYLLRKKTWNWPPWHRQVLAHILRKAADGTETLKLTGNHDIALRGRPCDLANGRRGWHRRMTGKSLFGVRIADVDFHTDPKGRRFKLEHGDRFDDQVFGTGKGFWYNFGDLLHTPLSNFDTWIQDLPKCDGLSVAAAGKKLTKTIINEFMGVNREISRAVDEDRAVQGLIYGHSHMGGMRETAGGKLLINMGCCTEHAQALVHDRQGNFALITWHKDSIDILGEDGHERRVLWKDLGLSSFEAEPSLIEDTSTQKADRLIRLIYRLWPPRERAEWLEERSFLLDSPVAPPGGAIPRPPALPSAAKKTQKAQTVGLKPA